MGDRFAEHPELVRSPIVPWTPTDPAPLSESYRRAVMAYLDREQPGGNGVPGGVPPCTCPGHQPRA